MSYAEVARKLDILLCTACGDPKAHWRGITHQGVLHWTERRMTKAGLRRFLVLAADLRLPSDIEHWQRVWLSSLWAQQTARNDLRIQLPRRLADRDRAYVSYLLSRHEGVIPLEVVRWVRS